MNDAIASSSPPAGAALRGLGETFQADLYTGTGTYGVALELPAAQAGFKPDLVLQYATASPDGSFGVGWEISLLALQRSTRRGIPRYDDGADTFTLSGADDLVAQNGNLFRPRVDSRGWRVERTADSWEVTTKDGVVHTLGSTAQARLEHPTGAGTYAWMLEEIRTPTGQSAQFHYLHTGSNKLLESVTYGTIPSGFHL
jgi:hypothetical protein